MTTAIARPIAAYLLVVALGVVIAAVTDAGHIPDAGSALALMVGAAVAGAPAAVLTMEFVHRTRGEGRLAVRAAMGGAAWAGWGIFVAVILATVGRLVLVPKVLVVDLLVCAAAGSAFSLLGLDGPLTRIWRGSWVVALLVIVLLTLGAKSDGRTMGRRGLSDQARVTQEAQGKG